MAGPAGYAATEAGDAEAALVMMTAHAPAALLCDVQMPGHDGLWVVERVRERFPTVAIVLATALETIPPQVTFQEGVVEYITKPFDRERVIAALARAMDWRRRALLGAAPGELSKSSLDDWLGRRR